MGEVIVKVALPRDFHPGAPRIDVDDTGGQILRNRTSAELNLAAFRKFSKNSRADLLPDLVQKGEYP